MNIKTCPHCGGASGLSANYSNRLRTYFVFVKCNICGSQGKIYNCAGNPAEEDWDSQECRDAIEAWNLRTNEK